MPTSLFVESVTPDVILLGENRGKMKSGASGCRDGMGLIRRDTRRPAGSLHGGLAVSSCHLGAQREDGSLQVRGALSPDPNYAGTLTLDHQISEL